MYAERLSNLCYGICFDTIYTYECDSLLSFCLLDALYLYLFLFHFVFHTMLNSSVILLNAFSLAF